MNGRIGLASKVGEGTTAWFTIPFNKVGHTTSSRSASISSDTSSESLSAYLRSFERMRGSSTSRAHHLSQSECRLHSPGTLPDSKFHQLVNGLNVPLPPTPPPVPTIPLEARRDINILVVEDNEVNQQIALRMIENLGFSVSAVPNGVEALRYLHACTEGEARKPNIVLMDIQMPEMDGYQATQIIRTGDLAAAGLGLQGDMDERDRLWLRGLPIIALTANAIRGDSDKCLDAGMDDYLAKPVNRPNLEAMLLKWLVDHMRHESAAEPFGDVAEPFGDVAELMGGIPGCSNLSGGSCCPGGEGKRANGRTKRRKSARSRRFTTATENTSAAIDWASCYQYSNSLPDEGDGDSQMPSSKVGEEEVVQEEEEQGGSH